MIRHRMNVCSTILIRMNNNNNKRTRAARRKKSSVNGFVRIRVYLNLSPVAASLPGSVRFFLSADLSATDVLCLTVRVYVHFVVSQLLCSIAARSSASLSIALIDLFGFFQV